MKMGTRVKNKPHTTYTESERSGRRPCQRRGGREERRKYNIEMNITRNEGRKIYINVTGREKRRKTTFTCLHKNKRNVKNIYI
jgi:hypothetical protein